MESPARRPAAPRSACRKARRVRRRVRAFNHLAAGRRGHAEIPTDGRRLAGRSHAQTSEAPEAAGVQGLVENGENEPARYLGLDQLAASE